MKHNAVTVFRIIPSVGACRGVGSGPLRQENYRQAGIGYPINLEQSQREAAFTPARACDPCSSTGSQAAAEDSHISDGIAPSSGAAAHKPLVVHTSGRCVRRAR